MGDKWSYGGIAIGGKNVKSSARRWMRFRKANRHLHWRRQGGLVGLTRSSLSLEMQRDDPEGENLPSAPNLLDDSKWAGSIFGLQAIFGLETSPVLRSCPAPTEQR